MSLPKHDDPAHQTPSPTSRATVAPVEFRDDAGRMHTRLRILGRGGEGTVISLVGEPALAGKIFHRRRPVPVAKVRWMVAHSLPNLPGGHRAATWPSSMLWTTDNEPCGLLMPMVEGTELSSAIAPYETPRPSQIPLNRQYQILRRLAEDLDHLHSHHAVVCDLQPRNIVVTADDWPVLLDADSFQITERTGPGVAVHPARVAKAAYLAPELREGHLARGLAQPASDWHAFAVIAFRLMVAGLHPFLEAEGINDANQAVALRSERQQLRRYQYRFANGTATARDSAWHDNLHPGIALLLMRCFTEGVTAPERRPTGAEWRDVLDRATLELATCWQGHVFPSHLKRCPSCPQRD